MTADNYHNDAGVLNNLLGITNANELREYDLLASDLNAPLALAYAERQTKLDMDVFCAIHEILFKELYSWAGKPRTVPLHKQATEFAPPDKINGWLDRVMPQFEHALNQRPDDFSPMLAELWGRLNWLHPFPEGNGRTTQIFITAVARQHEYDIDWHRITRTEELDAAKLSVQQDFSGYKGLLSRCLSELDQSSVHDSHFPTDRERS